MAGSGMGMNPTNEITNRKGNKMAKAAKTPKIAPEAPIAITTELLFM